jgi:LuxR family maltose regulon positive regulatory protein
MAASFWRCHTGRRGGRALSLGGSVVEHLASEYLVDRPALKRRMMESLALPLTLVVAQAGAGKTVLLNQWAADHPDLPFVWIDVDFGDDDPVRFSRRLLAELGAVRPDVMHLANLSALNAGGLGAPLLDALATELESFPECVIVLDDLHHLSNGTLMADIGQLIAAAPPNVHFIISTRVDPPIPWSKLRLRNRLLEIRQTDLAMTAQEAGELLGKITKRHVSPAIVDVLVGRTEGWAVGLQLAALTLKFQEHPDDFVADFGGTDRLIAEYLAEEVLDALPEEDRNLLLRMALLDTMTAGLVDDMLDRSDAHQLFERLEHESMFLVALDAHREHFRFHHLFRDLLRYRLRAEDAAEEARLLGRAADHHLARGELAPAVEYLLRARDWDRALDAIMTRGSDVFERGEMRTVIRWITMIPEVSRADRLDVALELAILEGMQGEAARAVDGLSRVANDARATLGQRMIAEAWSSATTQWNPHPQETIRSAERAIQLLESNSDVAVPDLMRLTTPELLKTLATGSGGRSHFLAGDATDAEAWLTRALSTEGIAYPPFRVGLLGSLALLRIWCGRAVDAELLATEAHETAAGTGLLSHPVMADAFLAEAMVAYERGLPESAAAPLQEGSILAESNHRTQLEWISRYQQALLASAAGRYEEALELVDLSRHGGISAPAPAILDRLVAVHMGVLRRTRRSEESLRLHGDATPSTAAVAFETAAAFLTLGDRESASRTLATARAMFEAEGPRGDIRWQILSAWTAELNGSHRTALDLVGLALDRAESEGLVEVFIESDAIVLGLIAELSPVRGGLAAAIVARWRALEPADANSNLPEPLTDRELEILAYLPGHSTSAELAKQFYVSVNTLKTHTAHIYRKLGVSDRSAAIAKARSLGLLGSIIWTEQERA